jgi:hypothetical protein
MPLSILDSQNPVSCCQSCQKRASQNPITNSVSATSALPGYIKRVQRVEGRKVYAKKSVARHPQKQDRTRQDRHGMDRDRSPMVMRNITQVKPPLICDLGPAHTTGDESAPLIGLNLMMQVQCVLARFKLHSGTPQDHNPPRRIGICW